MKLIKHIGLTFFLVAMATFISLLFFTQNTITNANLQEIRQGLSTSHQPYVLAELSKMNGQSMGKFTFVGKVKQALKAANEAMASDLKIPEERLLAFSEHLATKCRAPEGKFKLNDEAINETVALIPEASRDIVKNHLYGQKWDERQSVDDMATAIAGHATNAINYHLGGIAINKYTSKGYTYDIIKATADGFYWRNKYMFFILIIVIGVTIGGLIYILPNFFEGTPGIKHNGIYHNASTSRGWIGYATGIFMVSFYLLLYFYHYYIPEWITLMDPIAMFVRKNPETGLGEPSNQWFMYGFLYTVAVVVMGIRMFAKYRHSNYHIVRTISVMFFQLAFAFVLPQILYALSLPEVDLKNAWPLDYSFFYDWRINSYLDAGNIGLLMFLFGLIFMAVGVPLITFFVGKRWYCSWVCGCGGLAETLGDPYRQLSDKTMKSWKIERWLIHAVLVFASLMTIAVLYTFFQNNPEGYWLTKTHFVIIVVAILATVALVFNFNKNFVRETSKGVRFGVAGAAAFLGIFLVIAWATGKDNVFLQNSYEIRATYGLVISSWFAGVIGTGFYPVMGNRVWCRFGCPLAAYMGIVQRFKSRFRITTNGGQCISCGNCSTYCEQGIDVRAYAQRGQNIVRSSCVGCGVCSAVCPRGVLSLENGPSDNETRLNEGVY